jgi:fructose-1,6-bisphosphatase/inositol monophosphatase family enzyme
MVDRLGLHVGDEPCNVDHCHAVGTLPSLAMPSPNDADAVLELFGSICDATSAVVRSTTDWGESGRRRGQYLVDLDTDAVCVSPLLASGYSVLSEESGLQHPGDGPSALGTVVVDPLDGSTNASLGLPWCATSLCLVVDEEPTVAVVANLATGARYSAVLGGGATLDGRSLQVEAAAALDDAVIAISGLPDHPYGWRQFRAMGASALDICAVASGSFDGFVDMSPDAHGVWDYLGATLVVREAGGVVVDAAGRELTVLDHAARRTPVAATGVALLDELLAHRRNVPA